MTMRTKSSQAVIAIICVMGLLLTFMTGLIIPASASTETKGSITLTCKSGSTLLPGVKWKLYKVGERSGRTFKLSGDFADCDADFGSLSESDVKSVINSLDSYVSKNSGISALATKTTGSSGTVEFSDLDIGLYFVDGSSTTYNGKVYTPTSALLEISSDDLSVSANPKFDVYTPSTPSDSSSSSSTPDSSSSTPDSSSSTPDSSSIADSSVPDESSSTPDSSSETESSTPDSSIPDSSVTDSSKPDTSSLTSSSTPDESSDVDSEEDSEIDSDVDSEEDSSSVPEEDTSSDQQGTGSGTDSFNTPNSQPDVTSSTTSTTVSTPTTSTPTTSSTSSSDKLPQTGQLWWPVPILSIAGLTLIALGWRVHTKKDE